MVAIAILVASLVFAITVCSDSNEGDSVVGELYITDDKGWDYVLYTDGTASIIGTPDCYDTSKNGTKFVTNVKKVIDDIPSEVSYNGTKYKVTELGPSLFKGDYQNHNIAVDKGGNANKRYFTKVIVPDCIEKIGKECFAYNTGCFRSSNPVSYVEFEVIFGKDSKLKEIGESAFQNCTYIYSEKTDDTRSVKIPDTVDVIGADAFKNCTKMTSINLDNVKEIGDRAFYTCESLKEVNLKSAESIGKLAFTNIKELKVKEVSVSCDYADDAFSNSNVTYENGLPGTETVTNSSGSFVIQRRNGKTSILSYERVEGSTEVIIPKQVTLLSPVPSIKASESVSFEDGSELEEIGDNAFAGSSLKKLQFNKLKCLKDIGKYAFYQCINLEDVDLLNCNNLLRIQENAFEKSGVKKLVLPNSIQSLGADSFAYVPLTKISLNDLSNLKVIDKRAFIAESVQSEIDLSNSGIDKIEENAFKGRSVNVVKLNNCSNLTLIGNDSFYNMVVDISGCSNLQTIYSASFLRAIYDKSTARYVECSGSGPGVATAAPSGELVIDSNIFAINSTAIGSVKTVVLSGDVSRFLVKDGCLIDDRNSLIRILNGGSIVVSSAIEYVYPGALLNVSVSHIDIWSDVGASWIPQGCEASITVGSTCKETISSLDATGMVYGLGFSIGDHMLTIGSEIGMKYATPSISYSGSSIDISFDFSGGYSKYDIYLYDGNSFYHDDWTMVIDGNRDFTIKACERSGSDTVDVVFDANGGLFGDVSQRVLKISRGLTLLDSDVVDPSRDQYVFVGWVLASGDGYDFDSPLIENVVLKAEWRYIGPQLKFGSDFGIITATMNGEVIESGTSVTDAVEFVFTPYNGYLFVAWIVNGDEYPTESLTLNKLDSDISVSVKVGSYSADSLKSLVLDNPSIDLSDYSLSWAFGGVVDTSMSSWSGHPSNPIILGDYAYVRVSDRIYQISIETGIVVKSVKSVNQTDFYHHIGFANGMIVDYANGYVYDADLNPLFILGGGTISYAQYVDGMIVCMLNGAPAAFDANDVAGEVETKSVKWTSSENDWFKLYGTASTPMFNDGFMYYIAVNGKAISLKSIDLSDGKTKDSIALDTIHGHYLDDGWLSLYDGKLYLTSYAYGLFGASASAYKASVISSVGVDHGLFIDDTLTYTELKGYNSLTSQFVIFNNRGYVYTYNFAESKSALLVIDVSTMKVIYEIVSSTSKISVPSHGSIVVDASGASAENDYAVKIYVLSYKDAKLYVMEDNAKKTSPSIIGSYFGGTFCSQAVRFGSNGEMIWYDDSGYLQCYAPSNNRYVFIQDGDYAKWYKTSGKTASDAISDMGSDVITIDATTKTITSVNGKTGGDWSIYAYVKKAGSLDTYEWKKLENLNDTDYDTCHYFVVVSGEVPSGEKYTYEKDGQYQKYVFVNDPAPSVIVGEQLVHAEDVVRITFNDSQGELVSSYLIPMGKDIVIKYPELSRKGYSVSWLDASGAAAPNGMIAYNKDVVFHYQWIEISYSISVSKEESSGQLDCVATIARTSGSENLQDLMLFIIYEYDDGKFNNVYTDLSTSSITMTKSFGVSASGLKSIYLYVVDGSFSGSFNNYGQLIVDCSV